MYFYFYDTFLTGKKYTAAISNIETRLIHLGLQGRIEHCSLLKNADELILDGIKKGAKNIVAVGNDVTFYQVLKTVVEYDVTIGFIPVGRRSNFARALGIPMNEAACDVLSKRVIEKIDLGKINGEYFFSALRMESKDVSLECDGQYKVRLGENCRELAVCNMGSFAEGRDVRAEDVHNLKDGLLEAVIYHRSGWSWMSRFRRHEATRRGGGVTVLPVRRLRISAKDKSARVIADGQRILKTPALVEVVPKKLRIIVGKDRMF